MPAYKPNKGVDLQAVLDAISGDGARIFVFAPVVAAACPWNPALSVDERNGAVTRALFEADLHNGGVISKECLLNRLKDIQRELLSQPPQEFRMWSSLSLPSQLRIRPLPLRGVKLQFKNQLDPDQEQELTAGPAWKDVKPQPADYKRVSATVVARSADAARAQAFFAINLLRGIWEFILSRGQVSVFRFGRPSWTSSASVRWGPRWVLSGGADEEIQYGSSTLFRHYVNGRLERVWPRLRDAERRLLAQLQRISYRGLVEEALYRYIAAFDEPDERASFLGLWSVLELLLSVSPSDTYDRLIARAVKTGSPREPFRSQLQYLRDVRNELAHPSPGLDSWTHEAVSLQKLCSERVIYFHLASGHRFSGLPEAIEFLDLDKDRSSLRRQIRLRNMAVAAR